MSKKDLAVSELTTEYQAWVEMLDRLSAADANQPGSNPERTRKDTLAHVLAWQILSVARLDAAFNGHEPTFNLWPAELVSEDDNCLNDINAWIYDHYRVWPWDQVRRAWDANYTTLISLAKSAGEGDLLPEGKYDWLDGHALVDVIFGTVEHHREHRGEFSI